MFQCIAFLLILLGGSNVKGNVQGIVKRNARGNVQDCKVYLKVLPEHEFARPGKKKHRKVCTGKGKTNCAFPLNFNSPCMHLVRKVQEPTALHRRDATEDVGREALQGMPISELLQVRRSIDRSLASWPWGTSLLGLPGAGSVRFLQGLETGE